MSIDNQINSQRTLALGTFEQLKSKMLSNGYKAGSHIKTIFEQLNASLLGKDWFETDFNEIGTLIKSLIELQEETIADKEKMEKLKSTYGF